MATLTLAFTARPATVTPLLSFLQALPQLARGQIECADVGSYRAWSLFVCVIHFRGALSARTRQRVAYWADRCGALQDVPETTASSDLLGLCDALTSHVRPESLREAAAGVLGVPTPVPAVAPLAFELSLSPLKPDGLVFDPEGKTLFVPSARRPPAMDEVRVVASDGGRTERCIGTVARSVGPGELGPGAPEGFVLAISQCSPELLAALAAAAGDGVRSRRRSERRPVRVRAALLPRSAPAVGASFATRSEHAHPDMLEDLSQGGAFVRSADRWAPGTPVLLEAVLPDAFLVVAARVVNANARGVGLQFEAGGPEGDQVIAQALAEFQARPRRALVLDDDRLSRTILAEALEARGFAVLTADDGLAGLRALSDEVLSLDVVVTDLLMPNMDGEVFLRKLRDAGGERDLAVVVVSGAAAAEVKERLTRAGATLVLGKDVGAEQLAEAIDRASEPRADVVPGRPAAAES